MGQSNSPSENYLFLNVMVNFVIVNQKLTGSALHIEKNLTIQSLYFLNTKFHASSSFLCLYRSVCVGPVRKPHCWFSHEAAQMSPRDDTYISHIHSIVLYIVECKCTVNVVYM